MGLDRKSPVPNLSEVDEEAGRKSGEDTPKTRRRNSSSNGSGSSGKNGKSRKLGGWRLRPLLTLAACTVVFGPMGTLLTFMLLPDDHVWRLRQVPLPLPLPLGCCCRCRCRRRRHRHRRCRRPYQHRAPAHRRVRAHPCHPRLHRTRP